MQYKISEFLAISASIIQGTGIGPVSYVVNASDLKAIFLLNKLFKYADDTYLIAELSTGHFSWTRPDPTRRNVDPTRPALADKKSDPTRPDPRPDPSLICTFLIELNYLLII